MHVWSLCTWQDTMYDLNFWSIFKHFVFWGMKLEFCRKPDSNLPPCIDLLPPEFYVSNFNHLGWFTAVPDLSDSSVSNRWWFATRKQNNPRRDACRRQRCGSPAAFPQRGKEACWRRIIKFMAARFVVPYFIKSSPGGSSCCLRVCPTMPPLPFPSIHLNLFSPTVDWMSVF